MKLIKLGRLMTRAAAYAPVVVEPGTGEVLYVGQAPSASGVTWYMAPATGTVAWDGYDPTVTFADLFVIMEPGQGAASWTGLQPGLLMPVNLAPGTAAASWTGPLPTIVIVGSSAQQLAYGETDALAFDFTDDFFQASTGLYGSAYVVDSGTPANDYDSHPYGLLTYTSPSAKYCLQADGEYKLGAHNLYLNSAAPANQSITVVSGATYAITITGSVSITWSGAYTGTTTAGTTTFTAASTTLTGGSTSGSGTVHVRRTPSVSTYLATTSARYSLGYEWDTGANLLGIRVEEARTNLFTSSSSVGTKLATVSNVSWSLAATSAPSGETKGDTLTAAAGTLSRYAYGDTTISNATNYVFSVFAKAGTHSYMQVCGANGFDAGGTAYVNFDLSNGSVSASSTFVGSIESVGSGWYRCICNLGSSSSTSGRIFVSIAGTGTDTRVQAWTAAGTETIHVWGGQIEAGSFVTSLVETTSGATATRAADNISLATSAFPASDSVGTVFAQYLRFEVAAEEPYVYDIGNVTDRASLLHSFDKPRAFATNGVSDVYTTGLTANVVAKHAFAWASNDAAHVLNGGTPETDATVTPPVITSKTMYLGQRYSNQFQLNGRIQKLLYLPRRMSNADMVTLTSG